MKKSERIAKAVLAEHHGRVTTKRGVVAGNLSDPPEWGSAPETKLKHGLIARLTGQPPKEVK